MPKPVLVTIPFSHYCEKARWALQHHNIAFDEVGHAPLISRLAVTPRGGSTVPYLSTPHGSFSDSTDIVAFADRVTQSPEKRLVPDDQALKEDALALEDRFDRRLGVATRAWAYSYLLDESERIVPLVSKGIPRLEALFIRPLRPLIALGIRRGLRIEPKTRAWAKGRIDEDFAFVEDRLRDGRKYLTGDRFTVADMTFAALAAPAVFPDEYGGPLMRAHELPATMIPTVEQWRQTVAGQFALRIYREERSR
jgi:glutathione S-transferase